MHSSKNKKAAKKSTKRKAKKSTRPLQTATTSTGKSLKTVASKTKSTPTAVTPSSAALPFSSNYRLWKVIGSLFGMFFILIWLNHQSINTYYQQKYHQASPLDPLEGYAFWKLGQSLTEQIYALHSPLIIGYPTTHSSMNNSANTAPTTNAESQVRLPLHNVPKSLLLPNKSMGFLLTPRSKVFLVGDSMMQGVAPIVQNQLRKSFNMVSIDLSKQSTGLSYPKFYNWPKVIEETLIANNDIELLVVMLGANDPWDMPASSGKGYLPFGTEKWTLDYQERINQIYELAKQHHIGVIWVSAPSMRKEKLNDGVQVLNTLYEQGAKNAGGIYIQANEVFGYANGMYDAYSTINDKKVKIRADDGVHFSYSGQKLLAQAIMRHIGVDLLYTPPAPKRISVQSP